MKKLVATILFGAAMTPAFSNVASAATRTVCFGLSFREGRTTANSPASTEPGNLRGRHANNTPTPAVGHLYELWDKDPDGADEFIARYIKTTDGRGCATFEWEGAPWEVHRGEPNPDVYVKYINEVRHTGLQGDKVRALDGANLALPRHPNITWRNGNAADPDAYVAMNCTGTCDITAPGINLAITTSNTTARSDRVLALDTAQRALEIFNAEFDYASDGVIEMIFPCVVGVTPGSSCPGAASAVDRETFIVNGTGGATNGRSPAHELGHLLHFIELGRDGLAFDYSLNGASWGRTVAEFESAAVMEGWADFVSVASWWDDQDVTSLPRVANLQVEAAQPFNATCSANSGLPLQVTKGFWDLIDANNEAAVAPANRADTFDTSPRAVSDGWARFGDGTGNRDDNEPSGGDSDGRNLRDYFHNNKSVFGSGFFTSLMNHNCTGTQDNN